MCIHLRIYFEGSDRQLLRHFKRNTFQFCFYCHILFLLMLPVESCPGGRGQRQLYRNRRIFGNFNVSSENVWTFTVGKGFEFL